MLIVRWIVTVFLCALLVGVGVCGSMARSDAGPVVLILFLLLGLTLLCVWLPREGAEPPKPPPESQPPSEPPSAP